MAEGGDEDRVPAGQEDFSFVERVRYMMYGEKEKEAFLIEKKEKEEKKKAKLEAGGTSGKPKKSTMLGQIKSFFVPQTSQEASPSTEQIEEDIPLSGNQEQISGVGKE